MIEYYLPLASLPPLRKFLNLNFYFCRNNSCCFIFYWRSCCCNYFYMTYLYVFSKGFRFKFCLSLWQYFFIFIFFIFSLIKLFLKLITLGVFDLNIFRPEYSPPSLVIFNLHGIVRVFLYFRYLGLNILFKTLFYWLWGFIFGWITS